jgi:hypothetical protein
MIMGTAKENAPHSVVPESGFVPDEAVAISIAQAVWLPIYGKDVLEEERPFVAKLTGDVWIVEGTLPKDFRGGVLIAEISKKTGKVIRISHSK